MSKILNGLIAFSIKFIEKSWISVIWMKNGRSRILYFLFFEQRTRIWEEKKEPDPEDRFQETGCNLLTPEPVFLDGLWG
jgi:hypothetical protein